MVTPIFIFSLPRSGSTLLQRILMSHKQISSISEPWIILPFVYSLKKSGLLAEYSQATCAKAIEDFITCLPDNKSSYFNALNKFIINLYSEVSSSETKYFLDKTPRYYFIIEEIAKIFPEAKYIFLFRNPVQILSSIIDTWGKGRLRILSGHYHDLHQGPIKLVKGYKLLQDKAFVLKYEELVERPNSILKYLFEYLDLEWNKSVMKDFIFQKPEGKLGDKKGIDRYSTIATNSLAVWKTLLQNYVRKSYYKYYIKCLDNEVLAIQGYKKQKILKEIKGINVGFKGIFRDIIDLIYSSLAKLTKANLFLSKNYKWVRKTYLG